MKRLLSFGMILDILLPLAQVWQVMGELWHPANKLDKMIRIKWFVPLNGTLMLFGRILPS